MTTELVFTFLTLAEKAITFQNDEVHLLTDVQYD